MILAVLIVFAAACNEGIDPITPVDPGPDAAAPVVSVISPTEGYHVGCRFAAIFCKNPGGGDR